MTIQECYEKLQGDFAGASKRLINEKLLTRLVLKFPIDPSMQQLNEAVSQQDIETSFRAVHTLKGVAANLGLSNLYQAAWNLTEQLRPRQEQADPELLNDLTKEYWFTIKTIAEFAESQG